MVNPSLRRCWTALETSAMSSRVAGASPSNSSYLTLRVRLREDGGRGSQSMVGEGGGCERDTHHLTANLLSELITRSEEGAASMTRVRACEWGKVKVSSSHHHLALPCFATHVELSPVRVARLGSQYLL